MNTQLWDIFIIVGFFIVAFGFLTVIGLLIYAFIELKKTTVALREFLNNTSEKLTLVLEETGQFLKSSRNVSDNVGSITENAKHFMSAIYEIATNIKTFSAFIGDLRGGIFLKALGVRSGIKAALGVLIKEFLK